MNIKNKKKGERRGFAYLHISTGKQKQAQLLNDVIQIKDGFVKKFFQNIRGTAHPQRPEKVPQRLVDWH